MANAREIKLRIKGINETKKITKAMKLISASKLKKAKQMHEATMPFFRRVQDIMTDILAHLPDIESVYFEKRENKQNKKSGYIVVASDKGLNGGYNHNIIKLATSVINKEKSVVFPIGNVVVNHMIKEMYNVTTDFGYEGEINDIAVSQSVADYLIDLYKGGEIDELYLIFTEMESALSLKPRIMKLLPLEKTDVINPEREIDKFMKLSLEPTAEEVFDVLASKFVKGILYSGLIESYVSEHSARMNAMDSATSNAEKIVKKLTLNYNRARQAAITQEISEIVGGAASV
jgi:F-type H+-transporting ATPase subunit gamma